jgi:Fe2+ or Zn2+ uptake regulation protein
MESADQLCTQLRAQGRRVTPQRRAIIQALLDDHSHPTAEQVLMRVRNVMPDLSPATVYNTLHELEEIGMLQGLDLGLGERHYDIETGQHAHLVCIGCGHVQDVSYDTSSAPLVPEHTHGFQVVDCSIIFRGYCSACASK